MKKILMILTMALVATSCMDILDVAPEDQIAPVAGQLPPFRRIRPISRFL